MSFKMAIRAVLIDLNGTLHIENAAIPGAIEALEKLKAGNFNIRFVTNTTKESKRILFSRLESIGFDIKMDELFTSLSAARQLIEARNLRPMLFLEESAFEDFNGISTDDPNAVVIGLSPKSFNYETLNTAFRLILNGAPLIGIHKGRYFQRKDGPALGPGAFVAGLEFATDKKADIVGKPSADFFLQGIQNFNCSPQETIMIGDDVRDDIEGAQQCGMTGMLVKTGKYRPGDENKISPPPNHAFNDFPEAVEYILSNFAP